MVTLDLHSNSDLTGIHHAFMQIAMISCDSISDSLEVELSQVYDANVIAVVRKQAEEDANSDKYETLKAYRDLFDIHEIFATIQMKIEQRRTELV